MPYNTEKIRLAYKSKHNFKRENQVILLMITDGKKWHYLAVKSLPALLRGITLECLQNVHLMKKKINLIIAKKTIVLKNCVKS